jgi:lysophospholipase L1-like esterase
MSKKNKNIKKASPTNVVTPNKEVKSSKSFSHYLRFILPALLLIISYIFFQNTFAESEINEIFTLKNTVSLYLLIFSIGIAIIFILLYKWRKVILFNWVIIFFLIIITEGYVRMTNMKNVLSYTELNSNYFFTDYSFHSQMLKKRSQGDLLYLHNKNKSFIDNKTEFTFEYPLNEFGANNCKSCNNQQAKLKILTLGDSFTFGMGAPSNKSWPDQLDSIIAINKKDNVAVCNIATSGTDPIYMLDIFRNKFNELYQPNILLVSINDSDINDIITRGGMNRYQGGGPLVKKPNWLPLYASSMIFRLFKLTFNDIDPNLLIEKDKIDELNIQAFDALFETMLQFKTEAYIHNQKLIFIYNPNYQEYLYDYKSLMDIINEARNMGMEVIDLRDYFTYKGMNKDNVMKYYWTKDFHNNALGYQLWAEGVYDYLNFKGYLNIQ